MPLSHDQQFHAVKLSEFRNGGEIWRVVVLNGPNLSADINAMGDFEVLLSALTYFEKTTGSSYP